MILRGQEEQQRTSLDVLDQALDSIDVYDSWKLQGEVERLWDELTKLETSMEVLFSPCDAAAKKEEEGGVKAPW
ncbi:hypothetical protein Tco_1328563 [Tanacetum coccineum]